jgi:hypothetical protein
MANLNFQQPPRSIANQNLRGGGFSTSSLSGHVTPTSGMFPGSTGLTSSFTPQQLSPNRNLQMGNRLFGSGQRAFPDRRTIPGLGVRLESVLFIKRMLCFGRGYTFECCIQLTNSCCITTFVNIPDLWYKATHQKRQQCKCA